MNIFGTVTALFSGERVSHTDTFILAGMVLALFVGIRTLRKRMQYMFKRHMRARSGAFLHIFGGAMRLEPGTRLRLRQLC